MSLENKVQSQSYPIRAEQKAYLDVLFNRFQAYQQTVQTKAAELRGALEEAIFYVKRDLSVPLDKPYDIKKNEDGSISFVLVETGSGQTGEAPAIEVPGVDASEQQ